MADCAKPDLKAGTLDLPDERRRSLDAHRSVEVSFSEVCAATRQGSEGAHLVYADQCLAAVLLPAEEGWFMQAGFGPCDHEAMFFDTLSLAADWVQERFAE
jgi:hypothetical protein